MTDDRFEDAQSEQHRCSKPHRCDHRSGAAHKRQREGNQWDNGSGRLGTGHDHCISDRGSSSTAGTRGRSVGRDGITFGLGGQIGAHRHRQHTGDGVDRPGENDHRTGKRGPDHAGDEGHVLHRAVLDAKDDLSNRFWTQPITAQGLSRACHPHDAPDPQAITRAVWSALGAACRPLLPGSLLNNTCHSSRGPVITTRCVLGSAMPTRGVAEPRFLRLARLAADMSNGVIQQTPSLSP